VLARPVLARAETGPPQHAAIGAQVAGRVWLFLRTVDRDRDHAAMLRAGVVFEEAPRSEPCGRVAVWRDAFGNRWSLLGPAPAPLC
jgi:hypothetical protein